MERVRSSGLLALAIARLPSAGSRGLPLALALAASLARVATAATPIGPVPSDSVPPPSLIDTLAAVAPSLVAIALCLLVAVGLGRAVGHAPSTVGRRGGAVPPVAAGVVGAIIGVASAASRTPGELGFLGVVFGIFVTLGLAVLILVVGIVGRVVAGRTTPLVGGTLVAAGVVLVAAFAGLLLGPSPA
jgi:hypothetical protein